MDGLKEYIGSRKWRISLWYSYTRPRPRAPPPPLTPEYGGFFGPPPPPPLTPEYKRYLNIIITAATPNPAGIMVRKVKAYVYEHPSTPGTLYRDQYEVQFSSRRGNVDATDLDAIMMGVQEVQSDFRRYLKEDDPWGRRMGHYGPFTQLHLTDAAGLFSKGPADRLTRGHDDFRSFLAMRVKRELQRRVRRRTVVPAGTALARRGLPRNVRELVLRKL